MANYFSHPSKTHVALAILGALLLALLIFHTGVAIGARHHEREEGGRFELHAPGVGRISLPHGFIEHGHGAVGTVGSTTQTSFTLLERDGATEVVRLASTTSVHSALGTASSTTLAPGEHVLVLGTPEADGGLSADVIRVFPAAK